MGLEDALPDDVERSSSSNRSGSSSSSSSSQKKVSIGSGRYQKTFTEEKWEGVKATIKEEFDEEPNEVVHNWSAQKRYEMLHEAAIIHEEKQYEPRETTIRSCVCCNSSTANLVRIGGKWFCPQHPAAKIAKELDES